MKTIVLLILLFTIYGLPTIIGHRRRVMWINRIVVMNALGFLILPWLLALWDAVSPFASTEDDPWPEHEKEAQRRRARRAERARA